MARQKKPRKVSSVAIRGAARARFQGRSSASWKTPDSGAAAEQPPAAAPPAPAPEQSFSDAPIDVNPDLPPDVLRFQHPQHNGTIGEITGIGDLSGAIDLQASSFGGARITAHDAPAMQLAPIDDGAIDRLWDWAREDREGVLNFLGFIPPNSRALFKWIENFQIIASKHMAWGQGICLAGELCGFVMLHPISTVAGVLTGDCHLYLAKNLRGNLAQLLPLLMMEADRVIPNVSLRVVTARDDEWARLLRGVGFKTQIVLTRPAASTGATNGV